MAVTRDCMREDRSARTQRIIASFRNDARNDLHALMGMLELIAQGRLSRDQLDYLTVSKSTADRLLRAVENVGILLGRDTEPAQMVPFRLRQVLSDLTHLMEALAARKGLALDCEILPGVPDLAAGDRNRLQDILIRLLDNAIRFTDRGSVRLVAALVDETPTGHRIQFDLCDTGPGVPDQVIRYISSSSPEQYLEHGLGLPIVQKLVRSMGGHLSVAVQITGGSRVSIVLPFEAADLDPQRSNDALQAAAPLDILIAEDSDDSYFVLEAHLGAQKHKLTRAFTGTHAVELFRTGKYDLVFMDVHMPDMDGYSATHEIRKWETGSSRARVPVVVLSTDSHATQAQNGARVGCSAYLTKPVSREALLSVVNGYATARNE